MRRPNVFSHPQVRRSVSAVAAVPFAAVRLADLMVAELPVRERDLAAKLPRLVRLWVAENVIVEILGDPPAAPVEPVQWDIRPWAVVAASVWVPNAVLSGQPEPRACLREAAHTKGDGGAQQRHTGGGGALLGLPVDGRLLTLALLLL